jgi:hypothetical protein
MSISTSIPQRALKFETQVQEQGRVEITVPLSPGARIVVFVVEESSDLADDLLAASQSSTDFWDNALDDEDWNNA